MIRERGAIVLGERTVRCRARHEWQARIIKRGKRLDVTPATCPVCSGQYVTILGQPIDR